MVLSERNCDLIQVGGLLDSKGYGIAFTPGNNNHETSKILVREFISYRNLQISRIMNI